MSVARAVVADRTDLGPRVAELFPNKHTRPSEVECWDWTGLLDRDGYGVCWLGRPDKRKSAAHRVAYVLAHDAIPRDLVIDHLCRNRKCVNPAHLEAVTNHENILRGDTGRASGACKRRSHCRRGHPLVEGNLFMTGGRRTCATCRRASVERRRAAARDARAIAA